ncbi:hypothetical protein GY45DRAFT_1434609 [Cubamyces sp. BRFM 1775]|nr:hypothetical protein GY45DRAFT_1434609 [Cubamyces sp. BRFM 1775]
MARDLPGMYWDEEKKRYFPLSSRPAGAAKTPIVGQATPSPVPPKRARKRKSQASHLSNRSESPYPEGSDRRSGRTYRSIDTWRALNSFHQLYPSSKSRSDLQEARDAFVCTQSVESRLADSGPLPIEFGKTVHALCARHEEDVNGGHLWIGDDAGWLFVMDQKAPHDSWREFTMGTQITSISRSEHLTLVTSLGSPSCILIANAQIAGASLLREFPANVCSDIRCGHVVGKTILVGGRRGVVGFLDAEQDQYFSMRSDSDIFSLASQDQNIVYMGKRNGVIQRWDLRQPTSNPDLILNMSEKPGIIAGGAPVQHLRTLHGYGLLVETMRGDLEMHDMRYLRGTTPLLQFEGHVSSYAHKLGIAIDPKENVLFVGGGDSRLRAWSLRTGQALHSLHPATTSRNPFSTAFHHPIRALEILSDAEKTYMWIGSDKYLHRLELGSNSIFR